MSNVGDIQIPRNEWVEFLKSFGLQHEGWLATISVAHGLSAPLVISNCRLQRIAINKGAGKCDVNVSVLAGEEQRIFSVSDPLNLTFKRDSTGAHQGLEMASADGSTTVLWFRAAAHPESLDGVLSNTAFRAPSGVSRAGSK
jgi:hypothetical protein